MSWNETLKSGLRAVVRPRLRIWLTALAGAGLAATIAIPVVLAGPLQPASTSSPGGSTPVSNSMSALAAAPTAGPVAALISASSTAPNAAPAATSAVRYSVRSYGATGNGQADDTAAFARAVAAAKAAGGTVFVPIGTYTVSHVTLPSNVQLLGESRTGSVIRYNGVRAEVLDQAGTLVISRSTTGVGISNLTLKGTGAPGRKVDEIVLGLQDAAKVTVRSVTILNGQGRGLFAIGTGCTGGVYNDILIQRVYGLSNGGYGVAFWLYDGPSHNTITKLTTDTTDTYGLALDAGSSSGPHAPVSDNVIKNLTVLRAARKPGAGAITWQGAQRNTLDGFVITNTDAQGSCAIMVEEDQSRTLATGNLFTHGTITNVGRCAINLQSAGSSNVFSYVAVSNIGRVMAADLFELSGTTVNGGMGGPTADNTFDHIVLTQTGGDYHFGVSLNSTDVPIIRNHFTNIGWASPSKGIFIAHGSNASVGTSLNANTGLVP